MKHRAGNPRVAADEDGFSADERAEGCGEVHDELGRDRIADDPPHARDSDLEEFHANFFYYILKIEYQVLCPHFNYLIMGQSFKIDRANADV